MHPPHVTPHDYFTFTLTYQLAEHERDLETLVERLARPTLAQMLIQIDRERRLSMTYVCTATEAHAVMSQMLLGVQRVAPSASFVSWVRRDGVCMQP
jgi:hypothetical protein